jgi:hypothetical protein
VRAFEPIIFFSVQDKRRSSFLGIKTVLVDGLFGEVRFYDMHFAKMPATLAFLAEAVGGVMMAEVPFRQLGGRLLEMFFVGCAFSM